MFLTCGEISARIELANMFCPQALAVESLRIMSNSFFTLAGYQLVAVLQSWRISVFL
jgi:hypothetical protein